MSYQKQKSELLDSMHPDEFRNPGSFNQIEEILEELCKAVAGKENPREFMIKAASNLFREGSPMVEKMLELVNFIISKRS